MIQVFMCDIHSLLNIIDYRLKLSDVDTFFSILLIRIIFCHCYERFSSVYHLPFDRFPSKVYQRSMLQELIYDFWPSQDEVQL